MSVTNVEKDLDALSVTVIADFDASVEQVWDLWADPRKLERWWGPPTYPDGKPAADMPVTIVRMRLSAHDGGTRMELSQVFASREQMQQVLDMGGLEGLQQSIGQMDAALVAA